MIGQYYVGATWLHTFLSLDRHTNIMPGALRSPDDDSDWVFERLAGCSDDGGTRLPLEYDLRMYSKPCRDQGNREMCGAFSGTASREIAGERNALFSEYMSPEFIYFHRMNKPSHGMYGRNVFQILKQIGSVPEDEYPYGTDAPPSKKLYALADKYRITNYAKITSVMGLKHALYEIGPCYIVLPMFGTDPTFWREMVVLKASRPSRHHRRGSDGSRRRSSNRCSIKVSESAPLPRIIESHDISLPLSRTKVASMMDGGENRAEANGNNANVPLEIHSTPMPRTKDITESPKANTKTGLTSSLGGDLRTHKKGRLSSSHHQTSTIGDPKMSIAEAIGSRTPNSGSSGREHEHKSSSRDSRDGRQSMRTSRGDQHDHSEVRAQGHALCVVGYDQKGFILRNSWGSSWNGDGHVIFPYSDWDLHWECWVPIDGKTIQGQAIIARSSEELIDRADGRRSNPECSIL